MPALNPKRLTELKEHANLVRQGIIRSLFAAGSGHSAGPLDMADVFTVMYQEVLRHRPAEPEWEDRDRLLLSCGHIAPVRYSAMGDELDRRRRASARLAVIRRPEYLVRELGH